MRLFEIEENDSELQAKWRHLYKDTPPSDSEIKQTIQDIAPTPEYVPWLTTQWMNGEVDIKNNSAKLKEILKKHNQKSDVVADLNFDNVDKVVYNDDMNVLLGNGISTYVVGGFVRDAILSGNSSDVDFVVVGATPEIMTDLGFKQVGADFPVFLHPRTGDEFALARKERKVGAGYHGFSVTFDQSVTLADDLSRRDLTINAMAQKVTGWDENDQAIVDKKVIDPFGGLSDLRNNILRPVSECFMEDPVRALRAARFSARYGFNWDSSLMAMVKKMVSSGEMDSLVAERVWLEVTKTLEKEPFASKFFEYMQESGVLTKIMPELTPIEWKKLDSIIGVDQRLMVLLFNTDCAKADAILLRLKASADSRRMCVGLCKVKRLLADKQKCTAMDLMNVIESFHLLRSGKGDLPAIMDALRVVKIPALSPKMLRNGVEAIENVGFDALTKQQRETLKGKEIQDALRDVKLSLINNEIAKFYGEKL